MKKIVLQPAFVLHSRPYRDTSLLVDLLTMQFGRLAVVARGARSIKSRYRGILSPFQPLLVTYSGKNDLRTLQHAEMSGMSLAREQRVLLSGFYLNELLIKLLPTHESYPEVYEAYQHTLKVLAESNQPEIPLRLFEKRLLVNLGYGLQLDHTVSNEPILLEKQYTFEFGYGFKLAKSSSSLNFSGQNLLALHAENLSTADELRDAKRLLREVLTILLGKKSIKSRELYFSYATLIN